ncbi:MAG: sigma factor [Leifsonia sp.]
MIDQLAGIVLVSGGKGFDGALPSQWRDLRFGGNRIGDSDNTDVSTDSEVIERSAVEPAGFAALHDRHSRAVFRYAAQRLGDHAAEDVMSETFLVAFERRSAYDLGAVDARS